MIIDISQHQGKVDFDVMYSRGIRTVIIRVSMGARGLDANFKRNIGSAWMSGMTIGCYHLWKSDVPYESQWANFNSAIMSTGVQPQLIALDVEDSVMRSQHMMDNMHAWLQRAKKMLPDRPYIYTSWGLWNEYQNGGPVPWAKEYPLWVCDPDAKLPAIPNDWKEPGWTLWQFSGQGNNCGTYYGTESHDVDLNMYSSEFRSIA